MKIEKQQKTMNLDLEKLNKNLAQTAFEPKFKKASSDANFLHKPKGLANLKINNFSIKENEEKSKFSIESENTKNFNSPEHIKNQKLNTNNNNHNNKNVERTTAFTSKNSLNSIKNNSEFSNINSEIEVKELDKLLKLANEANSSQDFLNKIEQRKLSNNNTLKKSINFTNEENDKLLRLIETTDKEETNNNSNIYKYFSVFEDKQIRNSPFAKLDKQFFIKKENDQRKIKLQKQKEERLDKLFNKELDYNKIVKENIYNLKAKFNKSSRTSEAEKQKFCSFYGHIRNITNGFPVGNEFTDYNDYSENLNNCNYNQTTKNYLNLFNKSNLINSINKSRFQSNSNLNAVSSYFGNNESSAEIINSPMKTKNHFSSSVVNFKKNSIAKTNYNNKKISSDSVNESSNLFEEKSENKLRSSINNSYLNDKKSNLNALNYENYGFNNDCEMGSQYGKKDGNAFIPLIKKKELYSSPRKDKYSFK